MLKNIRYILKNFKQLERDVRFLQRESFHRRCTHKWTYTKFKNGIPSKSNDYIYIRTCEFDSCQKRQLISKKKWLKGILK